MKHIDSDAFARRCEEKAEEMSTTIGKAVFLAIARAVEETPESVVRCKDCTHNDIDDWCPLFMAGFIREPNGYCSWGERGEDEAD